MNVTNGNKTTSCQDETVCTLQIYRRLSVKPGQSCILRVPKEATAATVIKTALATLGLDTSKTYVLVEVQEYGGEEWVLQASDQPVQRVLLWPRKAQDKHPQSDGYFFALQEGSYDGSIQYDVMTSVRQEKVAQGLANRGFVTQQPQEYDDLCNLPELTEESILGTLRHRFHKQKIYTFASNILIAVNPFKFLPIYNPRYVKMYENHTLGKLEPHVFAIADAAFHTMLNKRVNQCIVISGESGSGKTQSTNFLIHCLTALSQKGYTSGVERTILGAGPVLEAFGNAKTAHNNNSSRFGKFIQVNYLESGVVRGAVVEKYLLEKCRLVSRGKTERNYHVFYYLLIGASEEEKDEFKLLHPEQYHYLKEDQAEMKHEFRRLHQAMEMVGFLPSTKKQIFSVLSAILYLGNVTYQPKDVGEGLKVGPDRVLYAISDLLKVKVELLVEALTTRKAMTANDTLILPYSLDEAITARDSMAKSLYSALFDWIVLRINHALLNKRDLEESVPCLSIGVLDIFGFEDFKTNSFEQFCINYANEQLQYYCNQRIFTLEQEEYRAEGITWHNIDYPDNIGCISLFSKKPTGLFYLLDEESNFPRATDSTLLEKFKQQHQDNPFFVQTPVREPAFVIQHFAGKVKYQIKDFREKNTDHMRPDIVALLRSSECSYLRQLIGANPVAVFRWGILRATIRTLAVFNEAGRSWAEKYPVFISFLNFSDLGLGSIRELHAKVLQSLKQFGGEVPQKLQILLNVIVLFSVQNLIDSHSLKFIMDLTQHNRATRSLLHLHTKKKPPSISAQFQASLSKLLETLRKAEPFFVRCIRSNGDKREMHFDDALVLQQLRYTGMLQTVRIRRSGYGAKFTFKEFTDQFRVLLPKEISTPQQDITNLLTKMGLPRSSFQIGRTKVFLKESERQILQEALHKEVMRRIIILQRWFRACLMRKQYLREREGIITIQVLFRSWRYLRETYRCRAAIVIQTAWRSSKERAEYLKQREKLKKNAFSRPVVSKCFSCNDLPLLLSFTSLFGPKASGSHSNFPRVKSSATFPGPRRNPTIKISRATRVQEKWNASLDREITDSNELRHLDEFLGNQVCVDELSETEKIFFLATTQFRDTIKSMYSISNPNIGYTTLMSGYQTRVSSLAGLKKASEVPLVVNLFQSVLDGFIRGELKRLEVEPCKPDSPLGHLFSTYQVTIMQSCDQCSSFIWGMEKAFMCSSCKMVCHKKCLSKITVNCTGHCDRKKDGEQTLHFGVPVCALVRTADSVPFVMEKMLVHVEMNGLYTEGIYRKSGSVCRAKELHHLLEKSPQAVSFDNYPIHTITGLVKQWLRELPDPLMTYSLYNDFLYAADLPEESERLRALYRKLDELPPPNFSTLERLIFHLVKVAKEEAHNRMSVNALAIVFAPCILRCPDSSDPLLSMKDINKTTLCVEILINEQTRRYNQKMEEIQQLENAEAMAVKQLKLRRQNTRPKLGSDISVDGANLEIEKNLLERIKSIKKEKNDLAFRLPEFDQDSSDAENMDSESLVSSDSLLEDHCVSLDSEASLSANTALNSSKPEKPAKPHDPETGIKEPAEERNQNRSASRREGVQSMCVIQSQDGAESLGASVSAGNQGKRRFSDLDIPFIDEDV
uniref:Unconventional myosin-IXb-like n=1 Tax=Sinocyclocheilus rhinocerous TaxID=307959 RepID=A0A673JHM3_9TELE